KSPPVRILTATKDEKENALEYGLPSSHTLNTICLSGYLLHYVISCHENIDASHQVAGFTFACLFIGLIGLGRVYLGMHSVIDILGGLVLGLTILAFWLNVHEYIDTFVTLGQNVYPLMKNEGVVYKAQSTSSFRDVEDQLKKQFTSMMWGLDALSSNHRPVMLLPSIRSLMYFLLPPIFGDYVVDVEDVEKWVVWVKLDAFYAYSMVYDENGVGGVGVEVDPSSLWEAINSTIKRKFGHRLALLSKVKSAIVLTISSGRPRTKVGGVGVEDPSSLCEAAESNIERKFFFLRRRESLVEASFPLGFKMETEEPVSKNAITGIDFAYASVRSFLQNDIFLVYEAPVRCSATLFFLSYEFPFLVASSRKPSMYLSSQAVPRHFTVLSNLARNVIWLQCFANALKINWTSGALDEATSLAMDHDSCDEERGNGCGSNETPTKRVDGNLHGSSIREVVLFCLRFRSRSWSWFFKFSISASFGR
nr:lipid phosphate phosphatase delta-like [Tanacetum cinerariifolium]